MAAKLKPLPFQVKYEKNAFILQEDGGLPKRQRQYLETYLCKASFKKVIGTFRSAPVLSLYQAPLPSSPGVRSLSMRLRRRFGKKRIPATATLGVNKACQCACEHCSAYYFNKSSKPELKTEDLKQVIRETVDLGATQIIFLGGEPLLRGDLTELIRAVPPRPGHRHSIYQRGISD